MFVSIYNLLIHIKGLFSAPKSTKIISEKQQ